MAAGLNMTAGAAPATPSAGTHNLFFTTDGNLHALSDAAVNVTLATTAIEFATANVADEAITNAKLAHMTEATVKGRAFGAGTGDVTDLTVAELAAVLAEHFTQTANDADWTDITTDYDTTPLYPTGYTYEDFGYRQAGGVVFLRGTNRNSSAGGGTALIGTLPSGYRPAYDGLYIGHYSLSGTVLLTRIWVYANGEVRSASGAYGTYHLDGICFVPA